MRTSGESYIPKAATMVVIASVLLLLPFLGLTLFNSKGEPREAIVAVSILQSGNWILPVNYGADIPFKPPFLAWLIAIFAKIFNGGIVNEYLSRLPSALAAIAMICVGYNWAEKARSTRFAIIFSLVTLCSVEVFRAAFACRLDMVLTACMVIAVYMLYDLTEHSGRHRALRYVAVVALLTCATLTKGPVGALLPCFIIGVYRLFRRRRFWVTLFAMLGLSAAAMLLPALWAYAAYLRGGDHFFDLMMEENIGRLLGTMSYDSHVKPIWYNFVTLALGLLPWTLLLIFSLFGRHRIRASFTPSGLLSLLAAALTVGFYCIPESKRSVYLLPAYPFICYGIALVMDTLSCRRALTVFTWVIAVIAAAVLPAFAALQIWHIPSLPLAPAPWWAYGVAAVPTLAAAVWMSNRHSPVGHLLAMVWGVYFAYAGAIMPAVLNPRSDYAVVDRLKAAGDVDIVSLAPFPSYRFFTINFYMSDRLRLVGSIDEAERLPSGTILLIPQEADTTGLSRSFVYSPLLERSCDFRRPAGMAVRK